MPPDGSIRMDGCPHKPITAEHTSPLGVDAADLPPQCRPSPPKGDATHRGRRRHTSPLGRGRRPWGMTSSRGPTAPRTPRPWGKVDAAGSPTAGPSSHRVTESSSHRVIESSRHRVIDRFDTVQLFSWRGSFHLSPASRRRNFHVRRASLLPAKSKRWTG